MKNQITAFEKELYHKSEILPELLRYQQEVAAIALREEAEEARLHEVIKFFEKENKQYDDVFTASLEKFKADSSAIENLIKAEISGAKGESKVFDTLEQLECNNSIIRNLELNNDTYKSEIDDVVITSKGVFIVEVKNTQKNIFIDKNGDFYRVGKYQKFDSNIANKMQIKETLLREKLAAIGYGSVKIFSIVVFTNKHIEVQNKHRELKTCFSNQLPYIIEGWKTPEYLTDKDINVIEQTLSSVASSTAYPMEFDTTAVKENFIKLINDWENAKNQPKEEIQIKHTEPGIKSKIFKYVGMAASVAIIGSLAFLKR